MTNSPHSRFANVWWLIILLLLTANLIVLGGLLWLILSDLSLSYDLESTALTEAPLTFAPATSTLPPNATPEESRALVLVPVKEKNAVALLATLTTEATIAAKAATPEPSSTATPSVTATPSATEATIAAKAATAEPTITSTPTGRPSPISIPHSTPTIEPLIAQAGAGGMTIGGAIIVAPNLLPTNSPTNAVSNRPPNEPIDTRPTEPTDTPPTEPTNTAPTEPTNTAPTEPTNTAPTEPTNTAPTEPTNTPPQPTTEATIAAKAATPEPTQPPARPTLLPTQETRSQREGEIPTISIRVVSNGVLLRWTIIAGEQYRIYSNMGSGLEMYRLLGETDKGEWLDTSVESGYTYHYQICRLSDTELSNPIEISITTPEWAAGLALVPRDIATPMATPTLAPVAISIASRTSYLDSAGQFHVIALLHNEEESDLVDVAVKITLFNENDKIIQTVSDIPDEQGEEVAAGATIPMHITMEDVDPKSYTIIATGFPGNATTLPLLVEASQGSEASDGLYYIEGRLRNTGDTRLDFPRIVVVLLDDFGQPVNAQTVRPIPAQIEPDSTATFQMRFDYFPRVVNHEVYALP